MPDATLFDADLPNADLPDANPGPPATTADFELGRLALLDVTTADTIGDPAGSVTDVDGIVTVYFDTTMLGYPGWRWTASLVRADGVETSVLETELTPGDGALLSPDWIPWADRLADYKEAQAAGLVAEELDAHDGDDDEDDEDDDEDDDDEDLLHAGDLDGVDIDEAHDEGHDDADDDDAEDDLLDADSADEDAAGSALAALAVGDHDADEPEGESDDAGPQPPRAPRRGQRGKKQQQSDEGE